MKITPFAQSGGIITFAIDQQTPYIAREQKMHDSHISIRNVEQANVVYNYFNQVNKGWYNTTYIVS